MITPTTLTDAQLEYWAAMYRANPGVAARGVSFEGFLTRPEYYLQGVRALYVLSSKERAVLKEALFNSVRVVANGRVVEKLRHHRWPRTRRVWIKAAP